MVKVKGEEKSSHKTNFKSIWKPSIVPTPYGRNYEIAPGIVVPSASTVPAFGLPQQPFLLKWKVQNSNGNWETFMNLQSWASRCGAAIHLLAERYLLGEVVDLSSDDPADYYDMSGITVPNNGIIEIRKGFQSFVEFWEYNQPELIEVEKLVYSTQEKDDGTIAFPFCGRIDIICKIDGKIWVLDIKTSKVVKDVLSYQVQLNIYRMLYQAMTGEEVAGIGVIWAKKDFLNANPPKSVLDIHKYKVDEELVWDTYKMFNRCYDGYNPRHHNNNSQVPLVYERSV